MRYAAPGAHTHLYIQEGANKMKHRLLLILMLVLTACLSACGNKTNTTETEETTPVESTEDPFSLGGIEIDDYIASLTGGKGTAVRPGELDMDAAASIQLNGQ